ncbi:MAG: hypothetical protein LBB19_03095 [Puniceicoccales bacterium]|jgi:hypothetical protein|nr:hypothetical protein [Puniceicoccales bacterium]
MSLPIPSQSQSQRVLPSSDSPSQLNSVGKDPRGRSVVQNLKPVTPIVGKPLHSLASAREISAPRTIQQRAGDLFSVSLQAKQVQKDLSTQFTQDTNMLKTAQNEYNRRSWAGKTGLKIQSLWKRNAYARKIDYQEKLTQEITNHPLQKSMGAEMFRKENQNTIEQWLKGVEQCSPRRQPDMIKLILSKVIQTGNPADLTPVKNWARQHLGGTMDPYYYATPQEQLEMIQNLTSKIQNPTSRFEKSRLQNEFAEKLKGTVVKDEQTLNILVGFIKECPPRAQPELIQSVHDQLKSCGAPTRLTNSLDRLSAALRSSS